MVIKKIHTIINNRGPSVVQLEGNRRVTRKIKIYNLDMIISVGYRVKSKRGIMFRTWANKVFIHNADIRDFYEEHSYEIDCLGI